MSVPFAAGALYSTVSDLLLWDQALYTTKLLPQKALDAMFTPYTSILGYGWAIDQQFGRKIISHNGMVNGFVGNIARYPNDSLTVIVLSNLETAPIDVISKDLAAIQFDKPYAMPKERHVVRLDPPILNRYVGRYQLDAAHDIVVEITQRPTGLTCQVQGQSFALQPESETTFSSEDGSAKVEFSIAPKGAVDMLVFNGQHKATRMR